MILELKPMSEEKDDLLLKACREWNHIVYRARKDRIVIDRTSGLLRQYLYRKFRRNLIKNRSEVHHLLARHAADCGIFKNYPYTPNTGFFIPPALVRIERDLIILRLYPYIDIAFYGNDNMIIENSYRISKIKGKWILESRGLEQR